MLVSPQSHPVLTWDNGGTPAGAGNTARGLTHSLDRSIPEVLSTVLPGLLADAWDEGHAACIEAHGRIKPTRPNPYRPETITRDATDAPVTLAAPDAINPPPDPSAAVTGPHSPERTTR